MKKCCDELIRRLGEGESLRSLRLQKERLVAQQERVLREAMEARQAAQLREEIRRMGEEPCA